jgi:S-adenosylmethionine:tRNA ribosyltransferase-isomerase
MRVDAFDFELPPERIAQHPVHPRDAARLLTVGSSLSDRCVRDLPDLLRPGDLLVVNDTRVLPTRLFGHRGEVAVEATLHTRLAPDRWRALVRPGRRLKPGQTVRFAADFTALVEAKEPDGGVVLRFACGDDALMAALDRYGAMPLPPYVHRDGPDARDRCDYQTMFAARPGAVAAPTASLHFTPALIAALDAAGIGRTTVTLHVGLGTFQSVRTERLDDHRMHAEWGRIDVEAATAINRAHRDGGRVVAVGTTALRLLETAADDDGAIRPFEGMTDLFIQPGFRFRAVDRLMTNFHLPRSTLFMLVAAFAGLDRMQGAYRHAVAAGYRFYSYGDACLLEPGEPAP